MGIATSVSDKSISILLEREYLVPMLGRQIAPMRVVTRDIPETLIARRKARDEAGEVWRLETQLRGLAP
jgi:hypothetical protein